MAVGGKANKQRPEGASAMWVKIDDRMPRHPKVAAVGPLGFALDAAGICYVAEHLTDGFVPAGVVHGLFDMGEVAAAFGVTSDEMVDRIVGRLVAVGRWEPQDGGGWWVHDYLEYNPSAAEVKERRDADAERKREMREARTRRSERHLRPVDVREESGRTPNGLPPESARNPFLSSPSPSPEKSSSSEFSVEVQAEAELKDDDDENELRNDNDPDVRVDSAIEWLTDRDVERKRASGGEAIRNLKNYRSTCRAEREAASRTRLEDLARTNPDRPAGWLAGQVLAAETEPDAPPRPLEYEPTGVGQGIPPPPDVREHLHSARKRTKRLQDGNGGPT